MWKPCIAAVLLLWPGAVGSASAIKKWNTAVFRISCLNRPFLRISVFTMGWTTLPGVELYLTDPLGRTAGMGSRKPKVPRSYYGEAAEIPTRAAKTMALHLEVCNAPAGRYVLKVTEYGSTDYYLNVGGDNGDVAHLGPTFLSHPIPGRVCEYSFRFIMRKSKVELPWLDSDGHALPSWERPVCRAILSA